MNSSPHPNATAQRPQLYLARYDTTGKKSLFLSCVESKGKFDLIYLIEEKDPGTRMARTTIKEMVERHVELMEPITPLGSIERH